MALPAHAVTRARIGEPSSGDHAISEPVLPEDDTVPTRFPRRSARFDLRSLLRRLLSAIVSVWGVASIVFVAILLTGNPALALVSEGATAEQVAEVTALYGFDQPIWRQYVNFLLTSTGLVPRNWVCQINGGSGLAHFS
ncbi:MAG: hypothetical protein VB093_16820 [Propionicimonas sp.]|nr:hypothetical protein [Propionicimonas sp.]